MKNCVNATLIAAIVVTLAPAAPGQIRDQVAVYATTLDPNEPVLMCRYNRKLELLGKTNTFGEVADLLTYQNALAIDPAGTYWICANPLSATKLIRIDRDGQLLPSVVLGHNPVNITASSSGTVFALTRIPLVTPGPVYAVDSAGSTLWSNPSGSQGYHPIYPPDISMTSAGELWIGGDSIPVGGGFVTPVLTRIDPGNGAVVQVAEHSGCMPAQSTPLVSLIADVDGTMWYSMPCPQGASVKQTDGSAILKSIAVAGGFNGKTDQMYVDPNGDPWVVSPFNDGTLGSELRRYDAVTRELADTYVMPGLISQWSFGATGEEVFVAYVSEYVEPYPARLARLNVKTKVLSSVPLSPEPYYDAWLATGDPAGYLFATTVDPTGDNDGDGASNADEVRAGSHPFRSDIRPEGPKVYLSFATDGSNSIRLRYEDPDGLLDPAGGLDPSSLSLRADGFGEVLPKLWPFLSGVTVGPGGTDATLEFGLLPVPDDLKLGLEASCRDRTQAVGWDWQVTPPGHR